MLRPQRKKKVPARLRSSSWITGMEEGVPSPLLNPSTLLKVTPRSVLDMGASREKKQLETEEESSESDDDVVVVANVGKKRKGGFRKTNWIKDYLDKEGNIFTCKHCNHTWQKVEGVKFQSGNIKIHLERKHSNILIRDGILKQEANVEGYSASKLNSDLIRWLASNCLPLSIVDDPLFRSILINLGGQPVQRRQLVRKFLPEVLQDCVEAIQTQLKGDFPYAITSDGWTTSCNKKLHWSCTTVHWIDKNGILQKKLIDIGDLGVSATSEVIRDLWNYQIQRWKLNPNMLVACVVDGAANYKSASKRQAINLWCCCHRLNLVAKEILQHDEVSPIYIKSKRLVRFINKSFQSQQLLEKSLKQPGATRWNSAELMFKSMLQNIEPVSMISDQEQDSFTNQEWDLIEFLSEFLGLIGMVRRKLEADATPTSNLILPCISQLRVKWKNMKTSHPEKAKLIKDARASLERRIPVKTIQSTDNLLIIACWCDPRFSNFEFLKASEHVKQQYINFCKQKANEWIATQAKKEVKPDAFNDFLFGTSAQVNEVEMYMKNERMNSSAFDPVVWWNTQRNTLPHLTSFASQYLCIPASSAPSERVFSKASLVASKLRSRLTSDNAKALTFLAVNRQDHSTPEFDWE